MKIYRLATTSDASALIGLMRELGYAHTKESIAANLQRVEDRGGSVFVAMQNGSIVGYEEEKCQKLFRKAV